MLVAPGSEHQINWQREGGFGEFANLDGFVYLARERLALGKAFASSAPNPPN